VRQRGKDQGATSAETGARVELALAVRRRHGFNNACIPRPLAPHVLRPSTKLATERLKWRCAALGLSEF